MPSPSPFFLHANLNGLGVRYEEVREQLSGCLVASLQDTRVNAAREPSFPGFSCYSIPHGDEGPGVLLLVRSDLRHRLVRRTTVERNQLLQAEVWLPQLGGASLLVTSLYSLPSPPNRKLDVETLQQALSHPHAILLGDLNAKWVWLGCRRNNGNGQVLANFLETSDHVVLNDPSQPTFRSLANGSEDCLDWAICTPRAAALFPRAVIGADLGSDHLPLRIPLRGEATASGELTGQLPVPRWAVRLATDQQKATYARDLQDRLEAADVDLDPPSSPEALEAAAIRLEQDLHASADTAFRQVRPCDPARSPLPVWILWMVRERRRLRRQQSQRADPHLTTKINRLRSDVRKAIEDHRRDVISKKADALLRGPRGADFWPEVRRWFRHGDSARPPLRPPGSRADPIADQIGPDPTQLAFSDSERAGYLAQHLAGTMAIAQGSHFDAIFFEEVNSAIARDPDLQPLPSLETSGHVDGGPVELVGAVSQFEVETHLRRCRNGKAPGPDGVTAELIRIGPWQLIRRLAELYSASLALGFVPRCWKRGLTRMLPKPGKDHALCSSHRPITLTSVIGKLLERIVARRLLIVCERHHLLPPHQSGFRPGRSASEQVTLLLQRAVQAMNAGLVTAVVALDIARAYDSVWHQGLLFQVRDVLPMPAVRWLASFLQHRSLQVLEGLQLSAPFSPAAGVPQGSPLSPLLYILFTREMPEPSGSLKGISAYADDICLWASAPSPSTAWHNLQPALGAILGWSQRWRLEVSAPKTQLAFLTRRSYWRAEDWPTPWFDGLRLNPQPSLDLLGVRLDHGLSCNAHVRRTCQRLAPRTLELRRLMSADRRIPSWIGVLLYKALIRSALVYSAPFMLLASDSVWLPMVRLERRAIRAALRARITTAVPELLQRSRLTPLRTVYGDAAKSALLRMATCRNQRLLDALEPVQPYDPRRRPRLVYWRPPLQRVLASMTDAERAAVDEAWHDLFPDRPRTDQ